MELWEIVIAVFHISGAVVSLCLVPVLARRCSVAKAWGWLAVMFAAPWFGLALYLIFGENPLGRRRIFLYRQIIEDSRDADRRVLLEQHLPPGGLDEIWTPIEALAESVGALPAVGGNKASFLSEAEDLLQHIIDDIDRAKHHVHMIIYIYRDDETGHRVGDALARAVERGVDCRLLADAIGSHHMLKSYAPKLREQGVQVLPALPVNPLRRRLARIDLRNHRKIMVVDGRVGYLGSWNVADPDFGGTKRITEYHDLMMRLEGPAVLQVQTLFLEDWNFETGQFLKGAGIFPRPEVAGEVILQALPSGPLYPSRPVRDLPIAAINQARKRVVITTPYFIPDEPFMLALRLAVQRGVQVDIIIPERCDSRLAEGAARAYCTELMESDVRIYSYTPGFLHAKTLTVDDDFAMMGSANYDMRSFTLDVEANLLIYSGELTSALRDLQRGYMRHAVQLNRRAMARRRFWHRQFDYCAKLLSPLM